MKLNKAQVKKVLAITYPDYKGRTFRLEFKEKYYPANFWSGGTRDYFTVLEQHPDGIKATSWGTNPFLNDAHEPFEIPLNAIVVERTYFCGKDLGIRIYVNPHNELIARQLTA